MTPDTLQEKLQSKRPAENGLLANMPGASLASKKQKTILVAEHAGYCHGVEKAVRKTLAVGEKERQKQQPILPLPDDASDDKLLSTIESVQRANNHKNGKPVYVLGQLIHNRQVIDYLSGQGITTVSSLDEVPDESVCVIRTHGAPPELVEAAKARGIEVADATCPDVRLVQNKAIQLAEEGYTVVVVGKAEHPEVIGIVAYSKRIPGSHIVAVNKPSDLEEALKDIPTRRVGVVSQTTQMEETFFETVKALSKIAKELKVFNTICPATFFRQNSALELAKKVDYMVVIGGKNSSNTTHLAEICLEEGTPSIHVETYEELKVPEVHQALSAASVIGVTAGASTPDWLIEEALTYLKTL
ncbi:MAG: 4-hydroxy-3-methylbut-2-enyl diphosphate reductase [Vampirovibrionales bacterium]|nr:4-hydroxy-3-methylbut-2-enyl diphosphate reductase [Vampirovibrionales bacterium]